MKKKQTKKTDEADIKRLTRIKCHAELEETIYKYYYPYLTEPGANLTPIEIIGMLELVKIQFYIHHTEYIKMKNQNTDPKDYSYG